MSKKRLSDSEYDLSTFEGCLKVVLKAPQSAEDAGWIESAFNEIHSKYRKTHINQLIEAYHNEAGGSWNAFYLLELIALSGSKKAFPIFVAALNHELPQFRENAAHGLANIGDKQSIDVLRSAYDTYQFETEAETETFRKMIAKALWGD